MGRINTNIGSLIAQRVLTRNTEALNTALERLSTGLRINSGKDDPAGLIASETLKSEKAGIQQAINNGERANNIIGTAEGGLNEVSSLLTQLTSLIGQSANTGGLSDDERSANQLQVDSILETINRIAGTTSFEGSRLLDGQYAYAISGAGTSSFGSFEVNSAGRPNNANQSVVIQVANSATQGTVRFTGAGTAATGTTLAITGADGTQQLTFAASTSIANIATAINSTTAATGVTASAAGGVLTFQAKDYGAKKFVSVRSVAGATLSITGGTSGKDFGTDAVVTVNGASATANGLDVTYHDSNLDLHFDLTSQGYGTTTGVGLNQGNTKIIGITGGGATFSLGPKVTEQGKANIGIQSVSTSSLGNPTVGFLSSLGSGGSNSLSSASLSDAQKIVDRSIIQVSQLRGRLGAFQKYTIGSTVNALSVAYENASSAQSDIEDADFAEETANLTRAQILSSAATTVLTQANLAPQNALNLLRGT